MTLFLNFQIDQTHANQTKLNISRNTLLLFL
jgi:hypothetical protein